MASPGGNDDADDLHLFAGVRFVLVGFDSLSESQYRTEMVRRGGADAGQFGNGCTHVITCGLVYDDPTCVVARAQGNKVVTELWVEDSLDRRVLADANKVIYWPTRNLNGIPGSESLHICLTGYVRYNREDIMKMVSLMGAQFSKPLVGNKVTHLICYKFEGEKYEFAKKLKIKLANHRWLEDCLKSWEILPVDDYSKSGWDLEIMEMQAKDSEDEAEGVDRKPFRFKSRSSVKGSPNPRNSTENSANHDIHAPVRSPITPSGNREMTVETHLNTRGQIRKEDDTVNRAHDITALGTPNYSRLAISSNNDGGAPIQTPFVLSGNRENAAVRNLNSPNQIQEAKHKYGGTSTLVMTAGIPGTPKSNSMAVAANHHLHSSNKPLDVPNFSKDNSARKLLDHHAHTDVNKCHLTIPSEENCCANVIDPSCINREQYREDVATGNLVAVAGRSNFDDELASHEVNLNSGGNATTNNSISLSYSRKTLPTSLSPEGLSVHQMTSPQRADEIPLKADSSTSSLGKENQNNSENAKNVDGLDGSYTHKSKGLISSASLKTQIGKVVSEIATSNSLSVKRPSGTSEPAISSSMGTNLTKTTNIYLRAQQSGSFKSKRSRSKSSFKHGGPVNGIKFPELSAGNSDEESLLKERASLEAMAENKSKPSQSAIGQDGKRNPEFSFLNKNDEVAHASTEVNQHGLVSMHETENAHAMDSMPDTSIQSSRNLQQVSCCGKDDVKMAGAPDLNKQGATIDSSFKPEKMVYDANVKASLNSHLDTSGNVLCETICPKKVTTPRLSAGAKRPYCSSMEADGSVVNNGQAINSKSRTEKMIPSPHSGATSKNRSSSSSATECNIISSKEVPIDGVINTITKRQPNVHIKVIDAQVASNLELSKAVSQENIARDPIKSLSGANGNQHQINSPKKLRNTRVKNAVVRKSRRSDTNMTGGSSVNKANTVPAESLFVDLFPSENIDDCPKKLSSSASADGCETLSPENVLTARVRKVIAKRKIEGMKDKSASKHNKIGSAIVSAAKTFSTKSMEESACNISKVTADQDYQKGYKDGTEDVSGLFCKDTITIEKSEGPPNSKLRCSKRNKIPASDHDKENGDLICNTNGRTGSLNSKFAVNSMHNGMDVLGEHRRVKGNDVGTLIALDPAWFILSGQRQQRREYRSILRRLKGRVCRDSHNWSYKATHFITPNPLRRTEKLFAAAAAGRWILKSDYLTSCNEAGKFLEEEPFEWFGEGLNDNETISYEAPRKWRVLKQQLGHGAFYGMQIIVYGQLISPSLDTLKRAVRAGDGSILATSPPYTRFLSCGVDFAVLSASMPRADAWVQEFMCHRIPCVSADYLVEYVCKPSYPLDRHVLFKTNCLAKKSLDRLLKKQHEVATNEPEASEDRDIDDLSCLVCGQTDRGEVMLICGDEEGVVGCGTGMHIDCSDPPMQSVPDDDWLCPKCDISKVKNKPTTACSSKSRVSKVKTKPTGTSSKSRVSKQKRK